MPNMGKMAVGIAALVVVLCPPCFANLEDDKKLQTVLCSSSEWSLSETLVTAPLLGSYNVTSTSSLLSRFIPVAGTLKYTCSDDDDNGNMTVEAFLRMDESTAPRNTLRYVATAAINGTTVRHIVVESSEQNYVGRTLVRDVKFDSETSKLVLAPKEKFLGASFALVWMPSTR